MAFKVSFFYAITSNRSYGWSENFYSNETEFGSVRESAAELAGRLGAIHGANTFLQAWRITKLDASGRPTRQSLLVDQSGQLQRTNQSAPDANDSDYPTVAFLLVFSNNDGRQSRQWIRGIPDDASVLGGRLNVLLPELQQGIDRLLSLLDGTNSPWASRLTNTTPAIVFNVSYEPGTKVFTVPDHGYLTDQFLNIKGIKGDYASYLNGVRQIVRTGVSTFKLKINGAPTDGFYDMVASNVQLSSFTLTKGTWRITRITSRQVGGPFGQATGRRRTRR